MCTQVHFLKNPAKDAINARMKEAIEKARRKTAGSEERRIVLHVGAGSNNGANHEFYPTLCPATSKVVMVEPNPVEAKILREVKVPTWKCPSLSHDVVEVAVADVDSTDRTFYALHGEGSLLPESIPYVEVRAEKISVRACSVPTLLAEAGVKPEEIESVIVDAEGYDVTIVSVLFSLEGFLPAVIVWETTDEPLIQLMAFKGYDVHSHRLDMIAVLSDT